ncbi:Rha family transcriptional regulator [Mannheimia haemolytica]|uniref:Rha family transcriptional regulator n=1 Tax=Mannheimia haemolytica TaxID=75985 RepID=UPI0004CEA79F|nr:Rha family transcriptional regulator [Mannheimia haemolytica]MDW1149993.1 Rha family transcriptional regulator [Mannheimia haemolytica]MDW1160204.1 Rha family transcriptional regulator [Mannheimia haemolytica]
MMKEINQAVFPKVFHKETVAMTNTLKVAEYFEKRHDNILRRLETLECSAEFSLLNFKESYYFNEQNKKQPMYLMTQDGFTLLLMGFTGKKAMQFKESYISVFNAMRKQIIARAELKSDQHRLNEAIKLNLEKTGKKDINAYARENNLVYITALGATAKKWLLAQGYSANDEIRQHLNEQQLKLVDDLLAENAVMIKLGLEYDQRKARLQETALSYYRKQEGK